MRDNDRTIPVIPQRLRAFSKAKGFDTPEALARASLIGKQHVSTYTIKRLLDGKKSYRGTIEAIAQALGVTFEDLTELPKVRDAHGIWRIYEEDLVLPDLFEYAVGPKRFEATVKIEQRGRTLTGGGPDQDKDPVRIEAEMSEDCQYIIDRYTINNERLRFVGVFCLKYLNYGNKMIGYCLQRDTEHESDFVLGKLRAEYQGPEES